MKNTMKIIRQFFLALLGLPISITPLYAQWEQTNGPFGGTRISSYAVSGTTLFVGTNGSGVFRSTDNGTSWKTVNTDLT